MVMNNLQNLKAHHVRRNLNGLAHRHANEGLSLCEAHCFLGEISHWFDDIIVVECCT
jgi:hypothetical protein